MHTCKGNYSNYQERADAAARQADEKDKRVIFRNFAPFTKCIGQILDSQEIDVVMPMYNLIKYSDNYTKNIWRFTTILQSRAK